MKEIIKFYGKEHQSRIAMEECAELIQAINKCMRYPDDKKSKENLIEEIADVLICIIQLRIMYHITNDAIKKLIFEKLDRTYKRLERDKNATIL